MLGAILDNKWISRAGNLSFIVGAILAAVRYFGSRDIETVTIIVLLGAGVLLMLAPLVYRRTRTVEAFGSHLPVPPVAEPANPRNSEQSRAPERPTFSSRILNEGRRFWMEITNDGPGEVPDPPLILNLLVPKDWKVTAGDGRWTPSREDLVDPATGKAIPAVLWSFKDDDPPRPRLSQTYEFRLEEDLEPGAYPISLRLFGYQRFDGLFFAVPSKAQTKTRSDLVAEEGEAIAAAKEPGEPRPRGFPALPPAELVERLQALLRRGIDLANTIPRGEDLPEDSTLPGAVDAWEREVREFLKAQLPEWAFYFEKPRGMVLSLKHSSDALHQRLQPRLQRLSQIVQHVKQGKVADD